MKHALEGLEQIRGHAWTFKGRDALGVLGGSTTVSSTEMAPKARWGAKAAATVAGR